MNPKVSICITAYNHEKFISQALDSVLMQKTDFEFEILIGEDHSSDNTREIVLNYAKRYPNKIRLYLNDRKNVIYIDGMPTGRWNLINNINKANAKYIALLDGDDYWIDPYKLQKQVDYLDNHPNFSMCFHWAERFVENTGNIIPPPIGPEIMKNSYDVNDLVEQGNFIGTCSVVFRNKLFGDFPEWYYKVPVGDFPLHLLNAAHGKIGFIDEHMAVYRIHNEGIFGTKTVSQKCETTLKVYSFIGNAFQIKAKYAFKKGVLKYKKMLFAAYLADRQIRKAIIQAIDTLIFSIKLDFSKTLIDLIHNISPRFYKTVKCFLQGI